MKQFAAFLEKHRIFYGWVMVVCGAMVVGVTHGMVQNCFSLYIKPVTQDMGINRQSFGVCLTMVNIVYMVIALFSGKIFARINVHKLLKFASVSVPLAFLGYSFCNELWQFYALSLLAGLGMSFSTFLPFTLIISNWFEEKRGLAIGICFMGSGIGGMLFNTLGGIWISNWGWRVSYRIMGIIMASVMIPVIFGVLCVHPQDMGMSPLGVKKEKGGQPAVYGMTLKQAGKTVGFWALVLFAMTAGINSTMLNNGIVPHLSDIGYSPIYAAGVMSTYMATLACCKMMLGGMYDRLGMKKSTLLAEIAVITGCLGLYLGEFQPAHIMIVAGAALGCSVSSVAYPALAQGAFGKRDYIAINGIVCAAGSLSSAFAPVVMNRIYDLTGSYNGAQMMGVCLALTAIVLLIFIRPIEKEA